MSESINSVAWLTVESLSEELLEDVVVFYSSSYDIDSNYYFNLLSDEEKQKSTRFANDEQRRTWILSHAFLRIVCSHYLNREPNEIVFSQNENGKPFIQDSILQFNLSHTETAFLIAVSNHTVGIDLEPKSAIALVNDVADFCFSEIEKVFLKSSEEYSTLAVWTAKESYLKAIGVGLVDDLRLINVVGDSQNVICENGFSSQTFYCPNGEISTVVYSPLITNVQFFKLPATFLL
ncbi:MAG: 4'-phosphopantetheinyl transferase family protein [Bacteroidales bacterium]